jgi:hypothetical protein
LLIRFAARFFDEESNKVIVSVVVCPILAPLKLQLQLKEFFCGFFSRRRGFKRKIGFETVELSQHGCAILDA